MISSISRDVIEKLIKKYERQLDDHKKTEDKNRTTRDFRSGQKHELVRVIRDLKRLMVL